MVRGGQVDRGVDWCCKNEHTLGHVSLIDGVRRLLVYRNADCPDDVSVILTGLGVVKCSACKRRRTWHAGQDAIEELLELRNQRRALTDSAKT